MLILAWLLAWQSAAIGAVPLGQVVPDVVCAADSSQHYAIYLPADYTPARAWPVIFAFDPGARGRIPVERYQAAAAQYGFIVAGSNNSRNGMADGMAVNAMVNDVASRFQIDSRRIYFAGMSGGARVALGAALAMRGAVAGVIASSAGYPDGQMRKSLPFGLFMTAGSEDFNRVEMRLVDRALTTPHRLVVFEGGHTWLSPDLAVEAVEWMEIQAMKTSLSPKNDKEIDAILAKRDAAVSGKPANAATFTDLRALVDQFTGLRDVSAYAARAEALGKNKNVRAELSRDRVEDDREQTIMQDVKRLEGELRDADARQAALADLRRIWKDLAARAKRPDDSPDRRFARRVLGGLSIATSTTDPEYRKIIDEFRTFRTERAPATVRAAA